MHGGPVGLKVLLINPGSKREQSFEEYALMKLLLKLLIAGLLLMATGFAQELKRDARPQEPVAESQVSTEQTIATGVRHRQLPWCSPKRCRA